MVDAIPAPASSRLAVRAASAAPRTWYPAAAHAWRAAASANVLPAPATPSTTSTPAPDEHRDRTIAACSPESGAAASITASISSARATPTPAWRHRTAEATRRASMASISGVVPRSSSVRAATVRPSASRIPAERSGPANATTRSDSRNPSTKPSTSSTRPPYGRALHTALITSRCPNVDRRLVNPSAPANAANRLSAPGVPGVGGSIDADRPTTRLSASASKPSPSARARHPGRRPSDVTVASFGRRVAYVATCAARADDWPCSSRWASISRRRVENSRNTSFEIPATSAMPLRTGPHATPRRRVSSNRSCASYRCPTGEHHAYNGRPSSAVHR